MTPAVVSFEALSLALLSYLLSLAASPSPEVPEGVLRYIARAVAARARRSTLYAAQEADLSQEILARLWERLPDIAAWASFSNREFGDPAYERFHDVLKSTVRTVLDRAGRTR